MIRSYLRLVAFTAALLVGVQLPGFIEQYRQRVDAHFLEAQQNLSGFQATARLFFNGDIPALIAHYAASPDPVMRSDAASIQSIYDRYRMLAAEQAFLAGPWYAVAWHVAFAHDRGLFDETLKQYSYTVPLSPQAIAWGVAAGLAASILIEAAWLILWRLLKGRRPAHAPRAF